MTKPLIPFWDKAETHSVVPPLGKQLLGHEPGKPPSAQYANDRMLNTWRWIRALQGGHADIVIGSSAEVTDKIATHTMDDLENTIAPADTKVLILKGIHDVGIVNDLILTNNGIQIVGEPGATIRLQGGPKRVILTGGGSGIIGVDFLGTYAPDSVELNGFGAILNAPGLTAGHGIVPNGLLFSRDGLQIRSERGQPDGYATLGADGTHVQSELRVPRGYISGLEAEYLSSTFLRIKPGIAADGIDNLGNIDLTSLIQKNVNLIWAEGDSLGARIGSFVLSGWYQVWIIKNPITDVVDAAIARSDNPPPWSGIGEPATVGYTLYRRVGWIKFDGSIFDNFIISGNRYYWDQVIPGRTPTGTYHDDFDFQISRSATAQTATVRAPPLEIAMLSFSASPTGAYGSLSDVIRGYLVGAVSPGFKDLIVIHTDQPNDGADYTQYVEIPVSAGSQIQLWASQALGSIGGEWNGFSIGWIDHRRV